MNKEQTNITSFQVFLPLLHMDKEQIKILQISKFSYHCLFNMLSKPHKIMQHDKVGIWEKESTAAAIAC